jgi:hypothetical protein
MHKKHALRSAGSQLGDKLRVAKVTLLHPRNAPKIGKNSIFHPVGPMLAFIDWSAMTP